MRHYEIVFLVHPDQSDQTSSILSKLEKVVDDSGGKVHRSENIGNRKLAYPIQDQFKASYGLINIECDQDTVEEIKNSFKFNDSIIRNLILFTIVAGGLHWWFYVKKGQDMKFKYDPHPMKKKSKLFSFGSQTYDNIFWSVVSGVTIWILYEILLLWSFGNGKIDIFYFKTVFFK